MGYATLCRMRQTKGLDKLNNILSMKKILFTLLSLLCCMTTAWAGTGDGSQADDDVIEVGDLETLKETIQNDNAAKIRLTDDIIVRPLFDMLCTEFKGEIHGQGHTISGAFLPLFESMTDATIENITFKDFLVYSEKLDALGGIALTATGCTFHDITLDNFYVENHLDGFGNNPEFCTGALVGALKSCKVNVENVIVKNSTVIGYDERIGAIAGQAENTKFVRCEVDDRTGVFGDGVPIKKGLANYHALVGGLVGSSSGCIYENCIISALVAGDSEQIGGIVGDSNNDKLLNCVNTGLVMGLDDDDFLEFLPKYRSKEFVKCEIQYNGKTYIAQFLNDADAKKATGEVRVGGIVGNLTDGEIDQCTNYGEICSDGSSVGGIAGYVSRSSIYNCLSAGPIVYDNDRIGTIVGNHLSGEMRNCLALTDDHEMCGYDSGGSHHFCFSIKDYSRDVSDDEMTVSSKEMKSGLVARYLNDNNTTGVTPWRQNLTAHDGMEVDLFPTLDPTHDEVSFESMASSGVAIKNAKDLIAFAKQVNEGEKNQFACAHLEADIDMSEVENWTPIGSKDSYSQYRGCFDGRGHTIRNLKVSGSAAAGLFGVAHVGAEIRNLIIGEGSVITSSGDEGAGGIIGRVNINWAWGYVRIENCGSYADINVNKHGGGIFGRFWTESDSNFKLYVNDCWSMGTITAENGNSGLLCGYTKDHGVVSNCWSGGQLRNGTNKGIWPYSIENDPDHTVAECLVGYNKELNIKGCSIVNPDDNVDKYKEDKAKYPLQAGVEIISDESARSGELCYRLNKGVVDGTQTWYQTLSGENPDPCPVRTKLTDGTNMVLHYQDANDTDHYGNTSREEIEDVILGKKDSVQYPITDINKTGKVNAADLTTFIGAAIR